MYGDYHIKDKTAVRPSYLQHEDPYSGKASLYWNDPLFEETRIKFLFYKYHVKIAIFLCDILKSWEAISKIC